MSSEARRQLRQRLLHLANRVFVPYVVGLDWIRARDVLNDRGLAAVNWTNPREPGQPGWVVTDQIPEVRERVDPGSEVFLFFGRDGGAGVREPRRPRPTPRSAREMRPEPSDDANIETDLPANDTFDP